MLETIQKSGDLGLFLMNTVARFAKKLNMQDIQPMQLSIDENDKKQNDQTNPLQDEAKDDITDAQLASNVADTQVDEQGAPDLLS